MNKIERCRELDEMPKGRKRESGLADIAPQLANDLEIALEALGDVVTQYPLVHGEPVPAWIRNAQTAIKEMSHE